MTTASLMSDDAPARAAERQRRAPTPLPTFNKRPIAISVALGVMAFASSLAVEFVISGHAFAAAASQEWGWAFVILSVTFALGGAFGFRIVGYVLSRKMGLAAFLPIFAIIGCLGWSWWQLSGALAKGDEVHRAEKHRTTDAYAFAKERLDMANAKIRALDLEDKQVETSDVKDIVAQAQADASAEAESRNKQRAALTVERARLWSFLAGADTVTQADQIAVAQRRMRAIDSEKSQLLDPTAAEEPYKAAEMLIAARRAGIKQRRADANAERAQYAPVVALGDAGEGTRSEANMGVAALILALIALMGSGFELPAKHEAELRRERMDAENADRRNKRAQRRAEREAAMADDPDTVVDFEEASGRARLAKSVTRPRAPKSRLGRTLGDLIGANPKVSATR